MRSQNKNPTIERSFPENFADSGMAGDVELSTSATSDAESKSLFHGRKISQR